MARTARWHGAAAARSFSLSVPVRALGHNRRVEVHGDQAPPAPGEASPAIEIARARCRAPTCTQVKLAIATCLIEALAEEQGDDQRYLGADLHDLG